ncbi:hypothetical protein RCL_jg16678.t1 [Rhizophagus clarus]|uniref:Uncharacterized protein n=1 Tax=Rhizophagus clarus TaxID=94130 RepID=A0A8H3QQ74_9GLOM|nr:hypothetical protein RCL_jg16678.t1 [Rhizophagus clarus]
MFAKKSRENKKKLQKEKATVLSSKVLLTDRLTTVKFRSIKNDVKIGISLRVGPQYNDSPLIRCRITAKNLQKLIG